MRLLELSLKNIGPFDEAHLEFVTEPAERAPVTLEDRQKAEGRRAFDEKEREVLQQFRQSEYPFSLMFRVYLEAWGLADPP